MIDIKSAGTEDLLKVVDVATEFEHARQQAYTKAKTHAEFQPWFERAEALYQDFCAAYGLKPKPVFDTEEHIRLRIAQGHPDFLHYAEKPQFADVVPFSLPREGW